MSALDIHASDFRKDALVSGKSLSSGLHVVAAPIAHIVVLHADGCAAKLLLRLSNVPDAASHPTLLVATARYSFVGATPAGFYWVALDSTQVPFALDHLQGLCAVIAHAGQRCIRQAADGGRSHLQAPPPLSRLFRGDVAGNVELDVPKHLREDRRDNSHRALGFHCVAGISRVNAVFADERRFAVRSVCM
ncbi:hypothetical protein [Caballeronia sp. GAFFF1]|uniref:hypothetical protein n=1 Tax=Caballeronia sp. GAFFF1 TaxID=2921779 RepID=UPI0020297FC8|nr:hypothetical protein [Caballeronia sp. GAFFF1]